MALVQQFHDQLSGATRNKGEAYFRQGRVKIVSSDEDTLKARVSGSSSRPYTVILDWSDPDVGLHVECSCPHYDEGNFCKHIWATLLAAEASGVTKSILDHGEIELHHLHDDEDFNDNSDAWGFSPDDDDDDSDDEADSERRGRLTWLPSVRSSQPGPAPSRSSRSWHAELSALPAHETFPANLAGNLLSRNASREKQVHFILDVSASAHAGALMVTLFQRERRKNNEWGGLKLLKVQRGKLGQFAAADRRALALALGNYTGSPWEYGRGRPLHDDMSEEVSQIEIVPALYEPLLPELCATGRFGWVLAYDQPAEEARPLAWDAGEPWRFRIAVNDDAKKKNWTIRGEVFRGEQVAPLAEPVMVFPHGLVIFQDRMARLAESGDPRWLTLLRARDEVAVPYADREKLLEQLWAAGEPPAVEMPANLQLVVQPATPRGVLQVHAAPERKSLPSYHKDDVHYASVGFEYDGQLVQLDDHRGAIVDAASGRFLLRRGDAEQSLAVRLAGLRVRPKQRFFYYDPPGHVQFPRTQFAEIVTRLIDEGWRVEAEDRAVRPPGKFRATVASGLDWFDVETAIDFDGATASLPQLLAALQRNERFVQLDDGSQGILPLEWLQRFAPLAELATVEGDSLRFRPSQALLLDALLADRDADVQLEVDRQFRRMREKLQSFAGVAPREAPAGFCGELRPYQKQGLGWLAFLANFGLGGCLADDMGLGKTVQVLAWLVARRRTRRRGEEKRPSLVVCPKSVVFNWQLEAERFAPKMNVLNYTGLGRRTVAAEVADSDLVLTTYGTLRKDVESLKDVPFDYVILDEAQAIKNDQSISAKACRLLQARHRLALTGTPVENHLGDLWSLFEFLNPGMLGRSAAFRTFSRSANANGNAATGEHTQDDVAASLAALRRGLAPFILRRTKEQVLADLPKKSEQTLHLDLLPADRKRYNDLRDHYRRSLLQRVSDSGMNAARMHVLEALLRLRQTACHAGLVDKKLVDKPSAKIDLLLEQIDEVVAEGHKALVFSQFTSLLAIVRKQLDERGLTYEYLDGRTRNRQARVERFQNDAACPLFLISLKAGGTGLNLTAADYVFLLDPWWNPAVEAQAIDRAHRIGQRRSVFAYRLVARDTVEEKIIELQRQKRDLADAIISADGSVLGRLSVEDLQQLLS